MPDISYNRPFTAENVRAFLANVTISHVQGVCWLPYISYPARTPLATLISIQWHDRGHSAARPRSGATCHRYYDEQLREFG